MIAIRLKFIIVNGTVFFLSFFNRPNTTGKSVLVLIFILFFHNGGFFDLIKSKFHIQWLNYFLYFKKKNLTKRCNHIQEQFIDGMFLLGIFLYVDKAWIRMHCARLLKSIEFEMVFKYEINCVIFQCTNDIIIIIIFETIYSALWNSINISQFVIFIFMIQLNLVIEWRNCLKNAHITRMPKGNFKHILLLACNNWFDEFYDRRR